MALRIQYARRPDGARTAYGTMGAGPVLLMPPGGTTHLEWYSGDTQAHEMFCERLAERRTLVLYDRHGCGLSDRNRTSFTAEDDMLDLETVIEALGRPVVDLFGISWGGSPCLAYAARHPDKVRRMVLYGTGATGARGGGAEYEARMAALAALRRADWDLYSKTEASRYFPSGTDQETFQSFARMIRDSTTLEMTEQLDTVHFDNQSVLTDITTPTLVVHRRGDQAALFVFGQYMARRLPNCRFLPLEGDAHFPWVDDADSVLNATIEFLTEEDEQGERDDDGAVAGGPVTVIFTDVESHTSLYDRLGDEAARALIREHESTTREVFGRHGVAEVKTMGDGFMASVPSAARALACAVELQRAFEERNESAAEQVHVRIGLNAGEPIAEEDDLFGTTVIMAARIAAKAAGGEIVASDVVRQLVAGKGFLFSDLGETELRGFEDPVRLWEVRWREG